MKSKYEKMCNLQNEWYRDVWTFEYWQYLHKKIW